MPGNLDAVLERLKQNGSSLELSWGEDTDFWECAWITGGKRFIGCGREPILALQAAEDQARSYHEGGPPRLPENQWVYGNQSTAPTMICAEHREVKVVAVRSEGGKYYTRLSCGHFLSGAQREWIEWAERVTPE